MTKIDKIDIENINFIKKELKLQDVRTVKIKKGNYEIEISTGELRTSEVHFFNRGVVQYFITRLIDLQFPRAEYADLENGYIDPAHPNIYTTDVIIDTSLLDLIITDKPRYSNYMVTFDGSPLGTDGSHVPITLQTTNAIEVQAVLTIQLDTGSLDIDP